MQVRDVMTRDVQSLPPTHTVFDAATLMRDIDVGSVPVWDGRALIGIVTDRDIVVRVVAEGRDPRTVRLQDAVTPDPIHVAPEMPVEQAKEIMGQYQVRRLPVLEGGRLVGIVSLGDLAVKTPSDEKTGEALEQVSQPAQPALPGHRPGS